MFVRTLLAFAGLSAALTLAGQPAAAAPQVLGLMAMTRPVPLTCTDGQCTAHLSAFCLARERDVPKVGTVYVPADVNEGIALVVTTDDGRTVRLPGAAHLRFTVDRGYSAIRVSVPEQSLAALGAAEAAVDVGAGATLLPVAQAGDPDPLTSADIALATGSLRASAEAVFDRPGGRAQADAARLVGAMINAVPWHGRFGKGEQLALWGRIASGDDLARLSREGIARAKRAFDSCRENVDQVYRYGMRRCLEAEHDGLMRNLNGSFWDGLAGGV